MHHVFTKPIQCQLGHKMHLNICSPKTYYISEDKKLILTCVDLTHPKVARTQNACQLVLTKPYNACQDTNSISTSVLQTYPMPAKALNASQHVLTQPMPC
jgi:hypothetical protein